MTIETFDGFDFHPSLQEGLDAMGFNKPTPIQQQGIPQILKGKDLIACAQTGTGKTAAFILPVLNKIAQAESNELNTLIIAPTRELAIQIDQQIQGLAYFVGVSSIAIYGGGDGMAWEQQRKALEQGTEIVVATPGRLIALLAGGKINLNTLKHLVLDEADRMLDMGFSDDILKIINYLPKDRQTVLFSATMPPKIRQFSKKILNNPEEINIAISKTAKGVTQQVYMVNDGQKEQLLESILTQRNYDAVIIFSSTKEKVKNIYKSLRKKFQIEAFHSDLDQMEREKIMSEFKNKSLKILIGTDIISRGIDVEGIELVVNYDTPGDAEDYVHRVGRTARADKKGEAITFVNDKDLHKLHKIQSLIGIEIERVPLPEGISPGPEYKETAPKGKGGGKSSSFGNKRNGNSKGNGARNAGSKPPRHKNNNRSNGNDRPADKVTQESPSSHSHQAEPKAASPSSSDAQNGKFRARRNVADDNS
ncbi:RNA helicase [Echinicola pacifica]|uniref:RNA helicase n=1 Tax=Echinicola pacifica TaxID=346377 RepID=A0A918PQA2_9BACT|nr:DEAD/DEAH box helicase [Echinicola pacifica]GGZ17495.1 RNA helicase [Echinicola pacifica]